MVRPKKDAVLNGEGAETAVENGNVEAEGAIKAKGRPKKTAASTSRVKDALPKRTLRSNSKTTLDAIPVEALVEKKPKKAAAKSKKVEDTNGSSDEHVNGDSTNGSSKAKNGTTEAVQDKAAAAKGRKKVDKSSAANKVDSETDDEKTEPHTESNESDSAPEPAETEKPKPVKSTGATKGKKKAEKEPEAPLESDEELFPEEKKEDEKMEEDKEKVVSGRGKKKAEKPKDKETTEEEPVASKKAKKEPTKPKGKAASEEKTAKPETKKAGGKGKAAAAKEVAIEHWNADRVVKIFEPFCKPSIPFAINENKPRRGSFEIVLRMQNGEEKVMWTGIKKGPPRSQKFPSDDQIKKLAEQYFVSELF